MKNLELNSSLLSSLLDAFVAFLATRRLSSEEISIYRRAIDGYLSLNSIDTNLTVSGSLSLPGPAEESERYNLTSLQAKEAWNLWREFVKLQVSGDTNPHSIKSSQSTTGSRTPYSSEEILGRYLLALKADKRSEATIKNYAADLRAFFESFGNDESLAYLTKPKVTNYLKSLEERYSSSSIERKTTTLRQFLAWAKLKGYVTTNHLELPPVYATGNEDRVEKRRNLPSWIVSYLSFRLTPYLHLGLMMAFISFLTFGAYKQFVLNVSLTRAYPTTLTRPNRILSFQARLANTNGSPITSSTPMSFRLYDASGGGTNLWSGSCTVTPDANGIFSTLLGSTCGSEIDSSVFSENTEVWLEVQVDAETLSPRQRIASVAYALNAETLQGYPPSTPAQINTIPVVNNAGAIIIGAASPSIESTTGTFAVRGESLVISTNTGSGGDITLAPDGTGQVQVIGSTTTQDTLNITNANLTTGSLINGTVGNNNTGYKFLSFEGGSSPTEKFSVDADGDVVAVGTYTGRGAILTATTTGDTPLQVNGTGGNVLSVTNAGDITLATGAKIKPNTDSTTAINIANASGTSFVTFDTSNQRVGIGTTSPAETLHVAGTARITSLNTAGAVVYTDANGTLNSSAAGTTGQCLVSGGSGAPTWTTCGTGGSGENFWRIEDGAISPVNDTLDLLIGSNATGSATFGFINVDSGTPTFQIEGNSVLTSTTLGSTVVNSSLTSVGALSSGSITTGFGTISTTNTITGTTINGTTGINTGAGAGTQRIDASGNLVNINDITAGGTVTFNGLGTGVVHASGGVLSTSDVDLTTEVTGVLPIANGGTNTSTLGTAGSIAYSTGIAYGFSTVGSSGQCLVSGGAGAPTWTSCSSAASNYWQLNDNVLSPGNSTWDLAVGGTATSSSKFQVEGITGNTKIGGYATVSASLAVGYSSVRAGIGNAVFSGNVGIGTNNPTDILNVVRNQNEATVIRVNNSTNASSSRAAITLETTGALGLSLQATAPTFSLVSAWANSSVIANNLPTLTISSYDANGVIKFQTGGLTSSNIRGVIDNAGKYGIGTTTPLSTLDVRGVATISGTNANANLIVDQSGIGNIFTASASGATRFIIGNNGTLTFNSYQSCNGLTTTASGVVTCNTGPGANVNYWQLNSEVISPGISSRDLAIGGTSTASALFQVFGDTGNVTTDGTITSSTLNTPGGIIYAQSGGTLGVSAAGTVGQCLVSGGSGTPSWTSCSSAASNYWQLNGEVLSPSNSTWDLAVGGTATSSALFQVEALTGNATMAGTLTVSTIRPPTGPLTLQYKSGPNTWANAVTIQPTTGNVGIGTSNPANLLDVISTTGSVTGRIQTSAPASNTNFTLDATNQTQMNFFTSGSNRFSLNLGSSTIYSGGFQVIDQTATVNNFRLAFQPGNTGNIAFFPQGQSANTGVAIGTSTPLGTFDVRTLSGTRPVATISGQTAHASLVIDQSGLGDIFTASASGATRFIIGNNGTLTFNSYQSCNGFTSDASGIVSCNTNTFADVNFWQLNGEVLSPANSTYDLAIGGTATSSALFHVEGTTGNASMAGSLTVGTIRPPTDALTLQYKSGPDTWADGIVLTPTTGLVGIGTSTPIAPLHVSGGYGSNAAFVVNQLNSGDLIAASASGTTRFRVDNGGNVIASGTFTGTNAILSALGTQGGIIYATDTSGTLGVSAQGNVGDCLVSGGSGAPSWSYCPVAANNYWQLNDNVLSPANSTYDLAIGGTATSSALFHVEGLTGNASMAGTLTVSTIQPPTGPLILNYKSGPNSWLPGIVLQPGTGNVGIGVTNPQARLDIGGSTSTITNTSGDITIDAASDNISLNGDNLINFTQTLGTIGMVSNPTYSFAGDLNTGIYSGGDNLLRFVTDGIDRLAIDANGLVGIGTIAPTALLHVNGGYANNAALIVNNLNSGDLIAASASGTTRFRVDNSGNVIAAAFQDSANTAYYLDPANANISLTLASKAGIGTTTPQAMLHINDNTNETLILASASATLRFSVDHSGNVAAAGVYTGTPSGTLRLQATGSTPGNGGNSSIYFLNSSGQTKGRIDTAVIANQLGDGADGDITVSSSKDMNADTIATGRVTYADGIAYRINPPDVTDTSVTRFSGSDTISNGIAVGDELLVINLQGASGDTADVGNYEFVVVSAVSASTITFETGLTRSYNGTTASNQRVVIQRVPNYGNVTVSSGGTITSSQYEGLVTTPTGGVGYLTGIVAFRATGTVTVSSGGTISNSAKGYSNNAGSTSSQNGLQGNGTEGQSTTRSCTANGNGGGGGSLGDAGHDAGGGGGGGHAAAGTTASGAAVAPFCHGAGGAAVGDTALSDMFLGGGGGSGGAGAGATGGAGGDGGGIIFIRSNALTVAGSIVSNGSNGSNGTGEGGGGGGGSGGAVNLGALTVSLGSSLVTATNGTGGSGTSGGDNGGAGSAGRIYVVSQDAYSGTTSPTAVTATTAFGTNSYGTLYISAVNTVSADLAEYYVASDPSIQAGDVVNFEQVELLDANGNSIPHKGALTKSAVPYSSNLLGIISTAPGLALGNLDDPEKMKEQRVVALAGRIPVKIASTSAEIKVGDYLTSSFEPGKAMKATKAGYTVAKALEEWKPGESRDTIMVFVNLGYYDPDLELEDLTGHYQMQSTTASGSLSYQISNPLGELVTRVMSLAQAMIGELKAGAIEAQEIMTENLKIGGQRIEDLIASIVDQKLEENSETVALKTDKSHEDLMIKLGSNDENPGKLTIADRYANPVATIDENGNASFSGTLTAKEANFKNLTLNDASISGTLFANNIAGLKEKVENLVSENLSENGWSYLDENLYSIPGSTTSAELIAQITDTNEELLSRIAALEARASLTASDSAFLASEGLSEIVVSGDLMARSTLTVGSTILVDSTGISSVADSLEIQGNGHGRVNFLAGAMTLDSTGLVVGTDAYFARSVTIEEDLMVDVIRSKNGGISIQLASESAELSQRLAILNNQNEEVAGIDASGSAKFNKLIIASAAQDPGATATFSGQYRTNASTGESVIPAGTRSIEIVSPKVSLDSLVYVTPTSSTSNQVLYVSTKHVANPNIPGDYSYFIVSLDLPLAIPVAFNWWIIN